VAELGWICSSCSRRSSLPVFSGRISADRDSSPCLVRSERLLIQHARPHARTQQSTLALGAFLTTAGIVFNRINVVLFAMHLKGSMPQISPESYRPTVIEWGISIGLIAATIFLFGLGARLMPVLPKEEVHAQV
jgi:Ni/Fe-hydrogenase subunit HybB-like protein